MSNYVLSQAAKARECLVPVKSKAAYSKVYEDFQEWRRENSVNGVDENILLAFFEDLSHKYSPNTLWPKLSMLRSMLHLREKTDVKLFDEVEAFVKNKNKGYIPKKSEPLQQPYDGPYRVVRRSAKTFVVNIKGRDVTVSIDRLKPAYILNDDTPTSWFGRDTTRTTPTIDEPAPFADQPHDDDEMPASTTARTTRSGRRVRFPERLQSGFS
ncbi:hypothetical protein Zmor_002010 [Zophobas morio]|uniref:Uncharacterized protein n=2 Tax=Zophobas morio TaxID=2755281 RepID=A0AA38J3Q6_9CUCU|nr:hypothetical protein Zmor_002010 [Zophobas morio]